jgi:hypothetical protein
LKPTDSNLKLPFRKKKFRDLKEAMRHGVYSHPGGKNAGTLALEAGIDRLSDLSRYLADNPNDPRGKFLEIFIPLLIAMGEKGIEVWEYIGEEIRAAQEQDREDDEAAANRIIREYGPTVFEALKVKAQGAAKK